MKFEWNKKYVQIMICVCLAILFAVACVFFFLKVDVGEGLRGILSVFNPILYGAVIAYILNRIVRLFENKVFAFLDKKKRKLKLKRSLSVLCTYILALIVLGLFVLILAPQIWAGIKDLRDRIPHYIDAVQKWLTTIAEQSGALSEVVEKVVTYINGFIDKIYDLIEEYVLPRISGIIGNVVVFIKDLILGIILSIYFLLEKEKFVAQGKRIITALFSKKRSEKIVSLVKRADDSFGGYIVAMAFDSLLVGVECFVACSIVGIPYYPLVSLIVGVTNFIPFFGPFIGAIPSAFIIFIVDPISVVWFAIIILVIQQIDGNIIAPKIIGNHLNLSSVWVVIAITIMSGLFGFMGMLIGVPIFSLIYAWCSDTIAERLKKKGLKSETIDYFSDSIGKEIELERIEAEKKKEQKPSIFARIKTMFVWVTEHEHMAEAHVEEEPLVEDYLEEIDRDEAPAAAPTSEEPDAEKNKEKHE